MDTGVGWDFIPESGGQTEAGSGLGELAEDRDNHRET